MNEVLPDVAMKGCFFHYAQAIWRKIQLIGLLIIIIIKSYSKTLQKCPLTVRPSRHFWTGGKPLMYIYCLHTGDSVDTGVRIIHSLIHSDYSKFMYFITGLQPSYTSDVGSNLLMRKMITLPLLPSEHIVPAFEKITAGITEPRLVELTEYVRDTWLENTVWSVGDVCVFRQTIRTNNDVEGWHRRLNHRAQRGRLSLYLLIALLLYRETRFVTVQLTLLTEGKLKRASRKKYSAINEQLEALWDRYADNDISTSKLLRKCSRLTLPVGA